MMKTVLLALTYVAMVFVDKECPTASDGLSPLCHGKLILHDGLVPRPPPRNRSAGDVTVSLDAGTRLEVFGDAARRGAS